MHLTLHQNLFIGSRDETCGRKKRQSYGPTQSPEDVNKMFLQNVQLSLNYNQRIINALVTALRALKISFQSNVSFNTDCNSYICGESLILERGSMQEDDASIKLNVICNKYTFVPCVYKHHLLLCYK